MNFAVACWEQKGNETSLQRVSDDYTVVERVATSVADRIKSPINSGVEHVIGRGYFSKGGPQKAYFPKLEGVFSKV